MFRDVITSFQIGYQNPCCYYCTGIRKLINHIECVEEWILLSVTQQGNVMIMHVVMHVYCKNTEQYQGKCLQYVHELGEFYQNINTFMD